MIEIIPNWHPFFVHFTIGVLSLSAVFYLGGVTLKKEWLLTVARWNLWAGALITAGTVWAGFIAFYSVDHDGASHAAMVDHRNWALVTASIFALLALWAVWKQRNAATVSVLFVLAILVAVGLLAITGFKGGELVFRHGVGVMTEKQIINKAQDSSNSEAVNSGHNHGDHDH